MNEAAPLPFEDAVRVFARRMLAWCSFLLRALSKALCGEEPNLCMAERLPPRMDGMSCTFVQTSILPAWRVAIEREAGLAERQGRSLPKIRGLVWDNGPEGGRVACPGSFGRMRIVSPAGTLSAAALPFGMAALHRVKDMDRNEERRAVAALARETEE